MPEGRASGRSAATSIDGAEHSARLERVMTGRCCPAEPDSDLLQALSPVPRPSPVVSDCENSNLAVDVKVHDVVREVAAIGRRFLPPVRTPRCPISKQAVV